MIRTLESLGCDPNKSASATGEITPAQHAAREGHAGTLRVLASLPSMQNVHAKDATGMGCSPLIIACLAAQGDFLPVYCAYA